VFPGRRIWVAAPIGMAAVLVLVLLGTRNPPEVAFGGVRPTISEVAVVTAPPPPVTSAPATTEPDPTPPPDGAGPTTTTAAPVPAPAAVMTIGDSGMYDATPALRASFFAVGSTSSLEAAYPGVGLTNDVGDWRAEWSRIVAENDPGLSIVMLGGFDLDFLEANGPDAYGAIADELVSVLTANGGRVAWLSVLPCGRSPDQDLNAVFADVAARHPDAVAFVDTAPAFPGCATSTFLEGIGTVPIRKPDGWHLCPLGAEQFATYVHQAVADLGWVPPPVDGWQGGDWMLEPRYDDPSGGCALR
jgi:hypothetical protein